MSQNNKSSTYSPFLSWAQCNEIAERVWGLINTFNALPRFREQLKEWAAHCEGVQKKRDEWQKGRTRHECLIRRSSTLKDAERRGPPESSESWFLASFGGIDEYGMFVRPMRGWFPDALHYDNAPPEVCLPLPVPEGAVALFEMYAGLAAICDDDSGEELELEDGDTTRTDQKINKWINDDPLDDESSVELMIREAATASRYAILMHCVRQLPRSDRRKLNGWVEQIEADLEEWAGKADSGVEGNGGGDCEGFVPADTLWINHGIRDTRLSEAATAGKVATMRAPKGYKDSDGREVRKLYNEKQAIKHCSAKA